MIRLLRGVLLMLLLAAPAHAQTTYPQKPVRVIVPFPAGGANDALCRIVADKLSTVSQKYSREIRTSEFGAGLEGVLLKRAGEVSAGAEH